jgi:hypothetical protein
MVHMCAIPQTCTPMFYDMILMNMMGGRNGPNIPTFSSTGYETDAAG